MQFILLKQCYANFRSGPKMEDLFLLGCHLDEKNA